MERIKEAYIDKNKGLIFVTEAGKKYAYKAYQNCTGAIESIVLEEVKAPKRKESNRV